MSCLSTIENIDCFEVITNQPVTLQSFADRYNDRSIKALFTDKRISMILKDGRYAIHKGKKKYDIIEADALRPLSSYSGNIYSREYFNILSKKLTDNGIVATWVPTARVKETFCEVFPFVYEIGDFLLVGSNSYFEIDRDKIFNMLNEQFTKQHFEKGNIKIEKELRNVLQNVTLVQSEKKVAVGTINTDLFPRDEYAYFAKLFNKIVK